MSQPRALITGVCGQDGAYLSQLLLSKGYAVVGLDLPGQKVLTPPSALHNIKDVQLVECDITNSSAVASVVTQSATDEIYHLAGLSHVGESFQATDCFNAVNAGGTNNVFNAVEALPVDKRPRLFCASSGDIFASSESPLDEASAIAPLSPYGRAKAKALALGRAARAEEGLFVAHGILFNHESPLRPKSFLSRKLSVGAAVASLGIGQDIILGALEVRRDWGHAADYAKAMWAMLQADTPDDFVIASGVSHSVREFADAAYVAAGISLDWSGEGTAVQATDAEGRVLIRVDESLYRKADAPTRLGNAAKAAKMLGWKPQISFRALVNEMVAQDLALLETKPTRST